MVQIGTRADFYLGRGPDAEWLGSIAWDGYPEGMPEALLHCDTTERFRVVVDHFLSSRKDATRPGQGWPWPWDDSRTTDYAYAFDGDNVWCSNFGHEWFDARYEPPDDDDDEILDLYLRGKIDRETYDNAKPTAFPDMSARKNVARGTRSGMFMFSITKDGGVGIVEED